MIFLNIADNVLGQSFVRFESLYALLWYAFVSVGSLFLNDEKISEIIFENLNAEGNKNRSK